MGGVETGWKGGRERDCSCPVKTLNPISVRMQKQYLLCVTMVPLDADTQQNPRRPAPVVGSLLCRPQSQKRDVTAMTWSADGKTLVTGASDGSIIHIRVETGAASETLEGLYRRPIVSLQWVEEDILATPRRPDSVWQDPGTATPVVRGTWPSEAALLRRGLLDVRWQDGR